MTRVSGATLVELFARRVALDGDRPALVVSDCGAWRPISWNDLRDRIYRLSAALRHLGVRPGDRVVQLSENRPEWIVTDLAILFTGAVHVPIHATLSGPQIAEQIRDSGARVAIVSNGEQSEKLSCDGELVDRLELWSHDVATHALDGASVRPLADLVNTIHDVPPTVEWEALNHIVADDLATIIYTSGTTGEPKGVMLTHGNLTTNTLATLECFDFHADDVRLGFLPLSHIFARTCDCYCWIACGSTLALARNRESVLDDCAAVRPTTINGVPYFFEKVMRLSQEGFAHGRGGEGRTIRDWLGGRVRFCCSGGAALPDHVARHYLEQGVTLVQGYGLTETSPVITLSTPAVYRIGTVGRAIENVEVRIADDGEVLTRGPHVMTGYWNKSDATAEVLRQGWFHTGDLGEVDDDGFLKITGRKKELIVTAAGKNIAPVRLESLLTEDPLIDQAMIIGDGQSYLVALLVPNRDALRAVLAADEALRTSAVETAAEASGSRFLDAENVRRIIAERIAERLACVSHHEQVRRFALLEQAFSIESGELTPTLKLRRNVIARRYAQTIAALYEPSDRKMVAATGATR